MGKWYDQYLPLAQCNVPRERGVSGPYQNPILSYKRILKQLHNMFWAFVVSVSQSFRPKIRYAMSCDVIISRQVENEHEQVMDKCTDTYYSIFVVDNEHSHQGFTRFTMQLGQWHSHDLIKFVLVVFLFLLFRLKDTNELAACSS